MPFGLGVSEFVMIVGILGVIVIAAVGYGAIKLLGRSAMGGSVSRQELEQVKQDLERKIEALEERERLPKG